MRPEIYRALPWPSLSSSERDAHARSLARLPPPLSQDSFLGYSLPPRARKCDGADGLVSPEDEHFTGFVFKLQANMDPRHRDKVAFLRVCSGQFDRGMKARRGTAQSTRLGRRGDWWSLCQSFF